MHHYHDADIFELPPDGWPILLHEIPEPPQRLYCVGTPPPVKGLYLTIIGSRTPTDYGRACLRQLVGGLKGYPIIIVSGLALGIDGMAHEAALDNALKTIAFPGSGLYRKALYPAEHHALANRIIENGGCLLSEFANHVDGAPWTFPQRNRLMAGCSKATLIIEGQKKSGSLITTRLALDYNREVLAVPGPIDNQFSAGPNSLLRGPRAAAVSSSNDILEELGFAPLDPSAMTVSPERIAALDPASRRIFDYLSGGPKNKDEISQTLDISMNELNALVSFLEIDGFIRMNGNVVRRLG